MFFNNQNTQNLCLGCHTHTCLTKTKAFCQGLTSGQPRSNAQVYIYRRCFTTTAKLPLMHSQSTGPGGHLGKVLSIVSENVVSVAKKTRVNHVPLWDHGLSKSNFKLMWSLWLWLAIHESMNLGIHWVGHLGTVLLICTMAGVHVCSLEQ